MIVRDFHMAGALIPLTIAQYSGEHTFRAITFTQITKDQVAIAVIGKPCNLK